MKKLLVVVALVGLTGFAAEPAKDEHTAKTSTPTETSTTQAPAQTTQAPVPQGLTADKLAKLNQFVQACSVERPDAASAFSQLGNIR